METNTNSNANEIHITPPIDETTEIVCILDRSSSMSSLVSKTIEGYNTFLKDQKALPGKAKWTLCLFDGGMGSDYKSYEIVHNGVDIAEVTELNDKVYMTRGCTAMYDAIGSTIDNIYARVRDNSSTKVIVMIITDGEENSSVEYSQKKVFESIKERQETDKWAFLFLGANIDTMQAGQKMSMKAGNTMSYTNSAQGVKTAYSNMSKSTAMYRGFSKADLLQDDATLDNLIQDNGEEKENLPGNNAPDTDKK